MSAETPGTDRDTEAIRALLAEHPDCMVSTYDEHTVTFACGITIDMPPEGFAIARQQHVGQVLAAYVARKVEAETAWLAEQWDDSGWASPEGVAVLTERAEAAEHERDEARAAVESWVRNTVSADGRYYSLRDAVLGADTCPAHEFVPVAGHPDDDECTHRWDETDATYCGRPRADHEHDWDAEAVARAKQARAVIERVTALAASLRRPLGGSGPFGAGSPEQRGCDYAAGRLDATIARATHVHRCASTGYPDHEPSSSCLCICGERFDATHTEPTEPASDQPDAEEATEA